VCSVLLEERKSDLMLHTSTYILVHVLFGPLTYTFYTFTASHTHVFTKKKKNNKELQVGDSPFGKDSCVFNSVPQILEKCVFFFAK